VLVLAGCPRRETPPPRPAPSEPPIAESPLPPSGTARFEIGPITPRRSEDGQAWLVESSVRNVGTRASRDVKVWVEGLDENGARLAQTELLPTPQEIPPGGAATFVARLPGSRAISTFHVEAIGR
jgi:hypothetical protein